MAPVQATEDRLFDGRLLLRQLPKGHYRTNADALLLAAFGAHCLGEGSAPVAVDLGAGVGPVGLALLWRNRAERVLFVEVDPESAQLAQENLDANGWSHRGEVRTCSADEIAASHRGCADIVLCNPPYFEAGTGRPAQDPQKARARSGHLAEFVRATRALLGRRAKGCFVYPARDLLRLMAELRTVGLEPKRLRFVHPTAEDGARVALVEARAAKPGGLDVEKPLVERTQGLYTEEMQRILSGSP